MKTTTKQITVALVILIVVIAYNFSGLTFFWVNYRTYVPQDRQEMEWMTKLLDAKGINYWIDDESNIAISSDDNDLYEPLISKIQNDRLRFSKGFDSSDKEYKKTLIIELEKAGIEYRIDYKNEIRYAEYDQPRFKSIKSKVDNMLAEGILVTSQ
jgi:translation elongation factor EF-1alpha